MPACHRAVITPPPLAALEPWHVDRLSLAHALLPTYGGRLERFQVDTIRSAQAAWVAQGRSADISTPALFVVVTAAERMRSWARAEAGLPHVASLPTPLFGEGRR